MIALGTLSDQFCELFGAWGCPGDARGASWGIVSETEDQGSGTRVFWVALGSPSGRLNAHWAASGVPWGAFR